MRLVPCACLVVLLLVGCASGPAVSGAGKVATAGTKANLAAAGRPSCGDLRATYFLLEPATGGPDEDVRVSSGDTVVMGSRLGGGEQIAYVDFWLTDAWRPDRAWMRVTGPGTQPPQTPVDFAPESHPSAPSGWICRVNG